MQYFDQMLDIFQNSALVLAMFHFITGLPKDGPSFGESSNRNMRRQDSDISPVGKRLTLTFNGKDLGFKLKRQTTIDAAKVPQRSASGLSDGFSQNQTTNQTLLKTDTRSKMSESFGSSLINSINMKMKVINLEVKNMQSRLAHAIPQDAKA